MMYSEKHVLVYKWLNMSLPQQVGVKKAVECEIFFSITFCATLLVHCTILLLTKFTTITAYIYIYIYIYMYKSYTHTLGK